MNHELSAYVRIQAIITAAFSFFITGMVTALIYHQADFVPTDAISLVIDLLITCLLTYAITSPFARASLRRDKVGGLIEAKSSFDRLLARLYRRPFWLSALLGVCTFLTLSVLFVTLFALISLEQVPFYPYVMLKSVLGSVLGAFVTVTVLYSGMLRMK